MKSTLAILYFGAAALLFASDGDRNPPSALGRAPEPAREPKPPKRQLLRAQGRAILIAYKGASLAPAEMPRSKEDARALAGAISIVARSKDSDFGALAREWSDDGATRASGGFAGTVRLGRDADAVARTLLQMDISNITGPLESPRGFYLIERVPVEEVSYQAAVVTWGGVEGMPLVARTKEQALARAKELLTKARENPGEFDALSAAESDDPNAKKTFGKFAPVPRGDISTDLEKELLDSKDGEIRGPVETSKGFAVFRRLHVDYVTFEALTVEHREVPGAAITQVRSREDARRRAEVILAEARKPNANFAALVEQYAEMDADKLRKGRRTIGVSPGSPAQVIAVSAAKENEPFIYETEYGFFVMNRLSLERE
ncbi:MAG: peptidylprolyl isomerase [Planctomycetes bacterium]|nr:peptidylprolyl isomerase [Planctomycetota bacterium]